MTRVIQWLRQGLIISSLAMTIWVLWLHGNRWVNSVLVGDRASLYSAILTVSATLLGFVLTAVSVILVYASNPRLTVIVEHGRFTDLTKVFFATIKSLGIATLAALLALLFDREQAPSDVFFCICMISVAWATSDFIHGIHVFEKIVGILVAPSKARRGDKA
ncbi:MAG: hypothetical protein ACLQUY_03075 [Ktedonobacterales bacterium]